ncbi:uncharacterized protein LOC101859836 [Aplysia californica]|uniref:Uncharacterized protein LOC101859836 n=1 Tax=Aplysia californica TaxID=6500 RepID=A0ABM1W429_APLCA|nr:uncharacterized protein LOC101859836 [Aplysia californica]
MNVLKIGKRKLSCHLWMRDSFHLVYQQSICYRCYSVFFLRSRSLTSVTRCCRGMFNYVNLTTRHLSASHSQLQVFGKVGGFFRKLLKPSDDTHSGLQFQDASEGAESVRKGNEASTHTVHHMSINTSAAGHSTFEASSHNDAVLDSPDISMIHTHPQPAQATPLKSQDSLVVCTNSSLVEKEASSSRLRLAPEEELTRLVDDTRVNKRLTRMRNKLLGYNEIFLQQYDKDVETILNTLTKPSSTVKKQRAKSAAISPPLSTLSPKKLSRQILMKKKKDTDVNSRYPFIGKGTTEQVVTPEFESSKAFLTSVGVPCDELVYYPDIQHMSNNDVIDCVQRLKEEGVLVVFSLFLIQRMFEEIKQEREVGVCPPGVTKLKNRLTRLSALQTMQIYFDLCEQLEKPDLDPRWLLDRCGELDMFDDIVQIRKKAKMLRSLGATGEDILSNLLILHLANSKVKLYRETYHNRSGQFPLELFLAPTMSKFKELMGMGPERKEAARLLGISMVEFQACWGHKKTVYPRQLAYKIQMCLSAGIPRKDILNNITQLDRFPLQKCHAVLSSFKSSGLPASVYLLHEMEKTVNHSRKAPAHVQDPDTGDAELESGNEIKQEKADDKRLPMSETPKQPRPKQAIVSLKKKRTQIFRLIAYHLQLDKSVLSTMFKCNVNVESANITDVNKNLEFLLSQGFSKEQISACPMVLAHPSRHLIHAVRGLREQIVTTLNTSAATLSPEYRTDMSAEIPFHLKRFSLSEELPSSYSELGPSDSCSSVCFAVASNDDKTAFLRNEDLQLYKLLLSEPLLYLNCVQYCLEKENNFSLVSEGAQLTSNL